MINIPYDTSAFDYSHIPLPNVWTIRQEVESPVLADVNGAALDAVAKLCSDPRLIPGANVAVGVGSRGIKNLVAIVSTVIADLKLRGMHPFVVPAMGSHGGATAEGQAGILADYGITEDGVGAPIKATMEVVQVAALEDGYPVYFDANAYAADAVIVINRIKHHTDFGGEIESGLCKMCAIGLGKQKGASLIHRFGSVGLKDIMPEVGRRQVASTNVVGGIAILENPSGDTAEIHAVPASEIGREDEMKLTVRSRELSPHLAFDEVDVLLIDEMGKNISGSGIDTHVIGRLDMPSANEAEWDGPNVRLVCVLSLTPESHGNCAGIGLADIIPYSLIEGVNFHDMMMNHFTSGEGGIRRGKLPLMLATPEDCVKTALAACGRGNIDEVRLVRIKSTAFVTEMQVSAAMMDEVSARPDLKVIRGPSQLVV